MSRHEWAWLGSMIGKFRDQKAALGIYRLLPNVTDIRADLDARYGDLPMIQHLPIPTPKGRGLHQTHLPTDQPVAAPRRRSAHLHQIRRPRRCSGGA